MKLYHLKKNRSSKSAAKKTSQKKSGSFDANAQVVALNKAKDIALSQMTKEVKDFITKNFGDIDNWLTIQIESSINLIKKK